MSNANPSEPDQKSQIEKLREELRKKDVKGAFIILAADGSGKPLPLTSPFDGTIAYSSEAQILAFEINPDGPYPPPTDQMDLQIRIDKALNVANHVYQTIAPGTKERFRHAYVALYNAAKLGLEGQIATEQANRAVGEIEKKLIEDNAGPIKNSHIQNLAVRASLLSAAFLIGYVCLRIMAARNADSWLNRVGIDPLVLANFSLVWVGAFWGVTLSYGIRTMAPSLDDLLATDRDYLYPATRLLFIGGLAAVTVFFSMFGVFDASFGRLSISDAATNSGVAVSVGLICGIAEAVLPERIGKKANKVTEGV